jgi:hypothetical protein
VQHTPADLADGTTPRVQSPARATPLRWLQRHLPIAAVLVLAACAHGSVLRLGFIGDDYQWWQHARFALEDPGLLLAPFGGYRPILTCLICLEHLVFGQSPAGYLADGLALYLLCGSLLWAVAVRLGFGRWVGAGIAALWLLSPFSIEPLLSVAPRNYLLLMASWLVMVLVWPGAEERWTATRLTLATLAAVLSLMSLESWVVLPAFVLAFDLGLGSRSLRTALRHGAVAAVPVLVYLAAYLKSPPVDFGTYYGNGIGGAVIIPHAWAAFCGLTTLRPLDIGFGTPEALALVTMGLCGWLGLRSRSRAMLVGMAFFLLPLLPVVPVPFMTTRYTTIPLAGFLLVAACASKELIHGLATHGARTRVVRAAQWSIGVAAALLFLAGLAWVRGETADRRRLDQLHQALLAEASAFAPELPRDRVLVSVRMEAANPLLELSRTCQGLPKIYYPRHPDPYALIDTAAMWSWVFGVQGGPLLHYPEEVSPDSSKPFVFAHRDGGFVALGEEESVERALGLSQGFHSRVVAPWKPGLQP